MFNNAKMPGFINKGVLKVRKKSPELLLGAGIILGIGGAVVAYKTKPKIDEILEEAHEEKQKIEDYVNEQGYSDKYTKEDKAKDMTLTITRTGIKMAKAFAPAVSLGILSLTCILASHNILHKRNVALAAAYEVVDKSFKAYRNRVIERFGEEVDKELRFNVQEKEIEELTVNKDGKEKKKTVKEKVAECPSNYSTYARCFDSISKHWEDDPDYNMSFLITQQEWANDLLRSKGHLFLNEVYEMLGFPETKAGQIVGWVYDPDGHKHGKDWPADQPWDNYVDFGIYNIKREANHDFVNGIEPCIFLDFNVDGNILEMI